MSQVEQVIQKTGGFHLETHERDVREQENTVMRDGREQENTVMRDGREQENTVMRDGRGKQTQINTSDEHTEETGGDEVMERRLINGLQSQQRECEDTHTRHTPLEKSPSFKLNKGAKTEQTHESHSADPILFLEAPVKHT